MCQPRWEFPQSVLTEQTNWSRNTKKCPNKINLFSRLCIKVFIAYKAKTFIYDYPMSTFVALTWAVGMCDALFHALDSLSIRLKWIVFVELKYFAIYRWSTTFSQQA